MPSGACNLLSKGCSILTDSELQFDGALWSRLIDKWHLGALRLLDFSSFAILFAVIRPWLARWLTIAPLLLLGKVSLEVFCQAPSSCPAGCKPSYGYLNTPAAQAVYREFAFGPAVGDNK
jgi:OpgC protein